MDAVSDMLNRIKNAQLVAKPVIEAPFSKICFGVAKILEREGYIKQAEVKGRKMKKYIELQLKYQDKIPAIQGVKKISKPGQRRYARNTELRKIKKQRGILIISSSRGLMVDREAHVSRTGGEVLAEIW